MYDGYSSSFWKADAELNYQATITVEGSYLRSTMGFISFGQRDLAKTIQNLIPKDELVMID